MLEHLDSLVVKAVGESGGYGMLIGPHSTARERDEFRAKILADPRNFIAQPTLSLSRAPCFIDERIEPRHVDLRPYVLYGDRRHDRARRPDARRAAEGLARRQLVAGRRQQRHLGARRSEPMLLSRVADALYWISRYLERAEHTARLIDVRLDLGLDRTSNARRLGLRPPVCGAATGVAATESRRDSPAALVDALIFDLGQSGLGRWRASPRRARTRAQVREEISSDMWEQLNALFLRLKQAQGEGVVVGASALRLRGWSSKACTSSRA